MSAKPQTPRLHVLRPMRTGLGPDNRASFDVRAKRVWLPQGSAHWTRSAHGGTERRYGAGGEEMATSSLHLIDGVPQYPSRTTPAGAGAGSEQIPRRPGPE